MTDKRFAAYFYLASTGAPAPGLTVLADHYEGLTAALVNADLPTTEEAEGYAVVIDIDTTIPHIVIFHTADTSVAQQRIATDYEPQADLTPVLDAIGDLPDEVWAAPVRQLTTLPAGVTVVANPDQRTLVIRTIQGDSRSLAGGNQLDFPWSGWYPNADTVLITMRHKETGTEYSYTGTNPSSRVARLELTAEETEEHLEGDYLYDVELTKNTDVFTPYNRQLWRVTKDVTYP